MAETYVPGEQEAPRSDETQVVPLSLRDIFVIFFKAGLAFGGGLGILAILEDELVTRREAVTREDFLALYGIGRIVPSGTMTALAVAYGYRFGGFLGTVVALLGLTLPAFVLTVALTMAYAYFRQGPVLPLLEVTVLPAALALIVVAALRLGKDVFKPSLELVVALAAFVAAAVFNVNPAILLVLGGVVGIVLLGRKTGGRA